ncbi:hypothetical protein GLE_2239 [Lysobacter enzymogenes]|uniref:Uncharacterized protein n=1 Tax=Lysobacter enzymogenes TaxID=69 RepID=A0A0S2DG98_LYSEN|nr:hypothetical protein GLE_2239 [Lysobacter enzymogenes]
MWEGLQARCFRRRSARSGRKASGLKALPQAFPFGFQGLSSAGLPRHNAPGHIFETTAPGPRIRPASHRRGTKE